MFTEDMLSRKISIKKMFSYARYNIIKTFFIAVMSLLGWHCTTKDNAFPKASFAGKWEHQQLHNNLVLLIEFEKGKDYATITDVGTGEAPPFQLKAKMLANKLVIFPQTHVNDLYIELSVKEKQLIFKYQIAICDKDGKALLPKKDSFATQIYKRVMPY